MSQSSSQQKNLITACASFLYHLCGLLGVLLWKRVYIYCPSKCVFYKMKM